MKSQAWILFAVLTVLVVILLYAYNESISGAVVVSNTQKCYDSDGGINYYAYGEVGYKNTVYKDYCSGPVLNEQYCRKPTYGSSGIVATKKYTCPNDCINGVCFKANICNNRRCEPGENCVNCAQDCGRCSVSRNLTA